MTFREGKISLETCEKKYVIVAIKYVHFRQRDSGKQEKISHAFRKHLSDGASFEGEA